jgi:hypothetical protein
LNEHVLLGALQGLDDGLRDSDGICQDDANALRAFEQLDDDRCATHPFDGWQHVVLVSHELRGRDANIVAAEDLRGAELVPRVCDTRGRVGAKNVHLLELAYDAGAVEGDGGTDSWDDAVILRERLAPVVELGAGLVA